jgi:predicted transcriptional regulator
MKSHDEFRELAALRVYGELDASERERLERHLSACAECTELARDLEAGLGRLVPARRSDDLPGTWRAGLEAAIVADGEPSLPAVPRSTLLVAAASFLVGATFAWLVASDRAEEPPPEGHRGRSRSDRSQRSLRTRNRASASARWRLVAASRRALPAALSPSPERVYTTRTRFRCLRPCRRDYRGRTTLVVEAAGGAPSPHPQEPAWDKTHHLGGPAVRDHARALGRKRSQCSARARSAVQADRRAPTTIATMLSKMERKGVVEHRVEGRVFVYRPTVSRQEVHRTMVGDLMDRLFEGDVTALVSHLLSEREVDPNELAQLSRLIAEHKKVEARRRER